MKKLALLIIALITPNTFYGIRNESAPLISSETACNAELAAFIQCRQEKGDDAYCYNEQEALLQCEHRTCLMNALSSEQKPHCFLCAVCTQDDPKLRIRIRRFRDVNKGGCHSDEQQRGSFVQYMPCPH